MEGGLRVAVLVGRRCMRAWMCCERGEYLVVITHPELSVLACMEGYI